MTRCGTSSSRSAGPASPPRPRAPPGPATGRSTWTRTCPTSGSRSADRTATRSPPRSWRRPIPSVAKRLAALVADGGTARLWVPAVRARAEAFGPDADLRGPRDLPVLIIAPSDPAALAQAITALCADLRDGSLIAPVELAPDAASGGTEAGQFKWPHDLLGEGTVALFNRGTPGCAVTPGRDALDVALPRLRRLAERRVDRRRPADRAGRVIVRLAALVAHLPVRARVDASGRRLARGGVQRGRRGVQPRAGGGDGRPGGRRRAGGRRRPRERRIRDAGRAILDRGRAERHAVRAQAGRQPARRGPSREPAGRPAGGDRPAAGDRRARRDRPAAGWPAGSRPPGAPTCSRRPKARR